MKISEPVKKKDHDIKINGEALYASDIRDDSLLWGKLLRSPVARGMIQSVELPELPDGYYVIDSRDVTGKNAVHVILEDMPVFAEKFVEYIGDPILMLAGPDAATVESLVKNIKLDIQELDPCLDMADSQEAFFDYSFGRGDIDAEFAGADKIIEETFYTGYQEQAYLETQCMTAVFDGKKVTIRGSMQCPYYIHGAVITATGLDKDHVRIIQDITGGGFGGKEAFPSIIGCQLAVAAIKTGKPVRLLFDRREDMAYTSKRHPSKSTYKVAVKNGKISGIKADVLFNAGAYSTLSGVVLQRGVIAAQGVYAIPAIQVRGRAVKTNTLHCGAFRGFGAPQVFFAVEMMLSHVAKALGREPLAFKYDHMVSHGDITSTGGEYHYPVPLKRLLEHALAESDFVEKRKLYASQTGRYRKGIGLSLFFHGAGFTGSGEREHIKAVAKLKKYTDGTVEILASNTDMGQGIKTTFCKIVAHELEIPLEKVRAENPDTDMVPDSGPTVASRSVMIVGELLRRAALALRAGWLDGEEQVFTEHYSEPDFLIPFDLDNFSGDAYPTYSWGVNVVEVELDTFTAKVKILEAWGDFDAGTPIDEIILIGQLDGGFLQGLGYAYMEQMYTDVKGRIRNASFSDYLIPTSADVPKLHSSLHVEPYPFGPYGAKGAGELPLIGAAPAFAEAVEQAAGMTINHIPITLDDIYKGLEASRK